MSFRFSKDIVDKLKKLATKKDDTMTRLLSQLIRKAK